MPGSEMVGEDFAGEAHGRRMSRIQSTDEGRLAELGYKQELQRDWSMMHNFGVSFSIIVRFPRALYHDDDSLFASH